jgi:hypothetical protein
MHMIRILASSIESMRIAATISTLFFAVSDA